MVGVYITNIVPYFQNSVYIVLQCELLKTLHWNLSKKHHFKLWGEETKIHRLQYQRYATVCPPFCFFNPPFCKPSVLWSRKHLFATYPAPYGRRLSTLTPLPANTIIIFIIELAPCLTLYSSCISLITHISLKRQTSIQKITK